jgi:hypothetical protein
MSMSLQAVTRACAGALLFTVAALPAQAAEPDTCKLAAPPRQAALTITRGAPFFVFPAPLPAAFSGCQTMWDAHGAPWYILTFVQGAVTQYAATAAVQDGDKLLCTYQDGKPAATDGATCPAYHEVRNGFRLAPDTGRIKVPADQDPRR